MGDRAPDAETAADLEAVLAGARACTLCAAHLPLGPRPVLVATHAARLLIIGQAPGTKVHETGIPWNDASGDRLRHWLGIGRDTFYGDPRIAIVPMGFCYPGRQPRGGDNPPRPECAPAWHPAPVGGAARRRAYPPGRHVRPGLLPGENAPANPDRNGRELARLPAPAPAHPAPKLAHHRLAEAASVVRGGAFAGVAAPGGTDAGVRSTLPCDRVMSPLIFAPQPRRGTNGGHS